ncbi:hypothetical protein N136_02262 [Leifsonia aquatica ATCC 14665]|uniref:Uncharacterized protein n=1 Tax=Leifsonia aquatica ATCC 14665 TaxID=1358026 RepID=U2T9L1_LEIAQ|nr:hypothetical protein N136_02262 [Leifsonia aquatica ATCC 14665]
MDHDCGLAPRRERMATEMDSDSPRLGESLDWPEHLAAGRR